jgi:hypothetical protein
MGADAPPEGVRGVGAAFGPVLPSGEPDGAGARRPGEFVDAGG